MTLEEGHTTKERKVMEEKKINVYVHVS